MDMEKCYTHYGEHFQFWDRLSESEKELVCQNTYIRNFTARQNIHSGSDECKGLMYIESGELRVYILSENGKEITLFRLHGGDTCVLSASCVLQSVTFDVFIDCEADCTVALLGMSAFTRLIEQNVYAENFMLSIAVQRFSDVMWAMQQILFMSFDRRLAIFLNDEISRSGKTVIKLTHEQIAKYMGSAREVVSRMLKYFSEEGITSVTRSGIEVVDRDKLRKLI